MSDSAGSAGATERPAAHGRRRALAWAACVALILAGLGALHARGIRLETSVLAMLPPAEQDPALEELAQAMAGRASRALVVLVGHPRRERALEAAAEAERALRDSPEFASVRGARDPQAERAFFDLYFPWRWQMLAPSLRAELEAGAGPDELVQRVRGLLQGPTSSLWSGLLERDPLLLHAALLQGFAASNPGFDTADGFVVAEREGVAWALLQAETSADPFQADGQRPAIDRLERLARELAGRDAGTRVLFTGVPRFAAHARDTMKGDVQLIGTASMLGTALCILLAFRSARPFLLAFLPVIAGTAAATLATLLVFDRVHFLTLVFGTSLTGLGVDYALHYFAAHRLAGAGWDAREGMRRILPGITLGVVTSVLGFAGLFFTPFPVLRQFALFASVGLIGAWTSVVCWFPALSRAPARRADQPWLHLQCERFLRLWSVLRGRAWARALLGALVVAACSAPFWIRFEDDVRRFQAVPAGLQVEDELVREIAGRTDDSRFVVVEGASEEETLQRLESASAAVRAAIAAGELASARDLAAFLPSIQRQRADHALLSAALAPQLWRLRERLDELGFDAEVIAAAEREVVRRPESFLDVATWLASPGSELLRPLWLGASRRGHATLIVLGGLADAPALEARLAGLPGVHFVDRVRDLSRLVERYRVSTTRLVVIAYVGVLVALLLRFGPANGVRVMLPSVLSAGLTLALLSADGSRLNLFHLLGLLLVLGLAVDYGVIFAEHGTSEATALFAVLLSVLTTVMAFGLLAVSRAPPLWALGESVSLGIVLAFVFSPLSALSSPHRAPDAKSPC